MKKLTTYLAVIALALSSACVREPSPLRRVPTTQPARPPGSPDGQTVRLQIGRLFVPGDFTARGESVPVLIHFHGDEGTVNRNFCAVGVQAVVINVTFKGLSSAYAKPFRDADLLSRILDEAMRHLRAERLAAPDAEWGPVCVSSFSAGFGAVRELLERPADFERIDGLLMLDSLYAGYEDENRPRRVADVLMKDFRRFAQAAADGDKTFILTHSYLVPGTYAGTHKTADDLIRHVGIARRTVDDRGPGPMRIISRADWGRFHVFGCAGNDGQAHMQHLRQMGRWIAELPWPSR